MFHNLPFIDTNIFLRFLVFDNQNPHLSKKAKEIIKGIKDRRITVWTNILVISEIIFVLEKTYKENKHDIAQKLKRLLLLSNILLEDKPIILSALKTYAVYHIDFEDAYSYQQMKLLGSKSIYSFDEAHFKKLKDIQILS